jgi:hypothetical protein
MDDQTRSLVADCLDNLAAQVSWNSDMWQKCYELVSANMNDDELLAYVYDNLTHYSGVFQSRNLLGFRVKPEPYELADYRQEFRNVASALRARLSLQEARRKHGF